MIFHFLLLKAPVSAVKDSKIPGKCQKYLQKWGSLVRSSIPPAFTALQPNGPHGKVASATARRSCPTAGAEIGGKCYS